MARALPWLLWCWSLSGCGVVLGDAIRSVVENSRGVEDWTERCATDGRPADCPSYPGAPAPSQPPRRPPRCVADQLPEWAGASAREKKALLERCAPPPG